MTNMKILLIGECSNIHWTLAEGLRTLGHEVTVASDGSRWMDNNRDIDISRKGYDIGNTIKYLYKITKNLSKFKGYDVVQIKNPIFLDLKVEKNRSFYHFLQKNNKRIFLGAFGSDTYWIKSCLDNKTFRYSDYYIGKERLSIPVAENIKNEWIGTKKEQLNKEIAESCDGIISCLYEYYVSYLPYYKDKLTFIPEPINTNETAFVQRGANDKVRFFIGIQKERSQLKGTDILYKVLQEVCKRYPNDTEIKMVESVPYHEYLKTMNESDVMLDQLYSYTPAMNAFAAMAQGLVVVGGGEPEGYDILNENNLRPVINVIPDEKDIFDKLEWIILNKERIAELSLQSRQFVEKHHDYIKVAQKYIDFWNSK